MRKPSNIGPLGKYVNISTNKYSIGNYKTLLINMNKYILL